MTDVQEIPTFLTLTLTGGRSDVVRLDLIGEVIERQGNSMPYEVVGSEVHLTTGRCLEVKETPERIGELMARCWRLSHGLGVEVE